MRKTYQETTRLTISLPLVIDGIRYPINFYGKVKRPPPFQKGGYFTTDNEKVQKELESHMWYNVYFTCITKEDVKAPEPKPEPVKEILPPTVKEDEVFEDKETGRVFKTEAALKAFYTRQKKLKNK